MVGQRPMARVFGQVSFNRSTRSLVKWGFRNNYQGAGVMERQFTATTRLETSVKQFAYLKRRAAGNCKGSFLDMVTVPRLRRCHSLKPVVMLQT